jgi:chromosome segregation protein
MLKALELVGFKSFADRTRFEFPRGVSVVVGPNGSGKSNLVDAVKWVLGTQSAKSLRGKEMTDVIFNGAGSRGPLGTAEVTLTLDNSSHLLPIDAADVHITRRVYRSGEGEYLINRQPCRLRDIRDMLAGTGITTEAYSIIEQGKVDGILQSSPRDRRMIFEEAAGISRFKAKQASAARRLERVEQNLLRLSDIVDEVESRLRSVRTQAGKARRYREHANRLQHLRTQVGLVDWRALSKQSAARETQLTESRRRHDEGEATLTRFESQALEFEQQIETSAGRLRQLEGEASATREQIAARQAAVDHQRDRHAELEQEIARFRRQLAAMSTRAGSASEMVRGAAEQLTRAQQEFDDAQHVLEQHLELVDQSRSEVDSVRAELDQQRTLHVEAVRSVTLLGNQLTVLQSRVTNAQAARAQCEAQLEELVDQRDAMAAELAQHERAEAKLASEATSCETKLRSTEQALATLRQELARTDKQHRELERRLTQTRERIAVLTELHERLEGLTSGVKEVLGLSQTAPDGPWGDVRGVVADLFHVDVDTAPLVEVALGEQAQFLVVSSAGRLLDWLASEPPGVPTRVGLLQLDGELLASSLDQVDLAGEPGVMGRADQFVETAHDLGPLVRRLLGSTWFVDRLSTALRLWRATGMGVQFVTSDGQLLTADGTLVLGPRQHSTGLLLQRSELRACQELVTKLESQSARQQAVHARLEEESLRREQEAGDMRAEHHRLAASLAERRQQTTAARSQLLQFDQSHARVAAELQTAIDEMDAASGALDTVRHEQAAAEQAATQTQQEQHAVRASLTAAEQRYGNLQAVATEKQIAAAKCEQRVEMLRSQMEQARRDQEERARALADTRARLAARESQLDELAQTMLLGRQLLAELFLRKQHHAAELAQQAEAATEHRRARAELNEQIRRQRQQVGTLQGQHHKLEIAVSELRHERQTLCDRMRDDYGIDLAAAAAEADDLQPIEHREAVEREIAELRNQINNIGAVNLDALDELDNLESRFGHLSQQYRDLVDAKASLERIIARIHTDSRQLFIATLEVVRGHFQELFRQLFGGGEANIVLDDEEDVLECGVEIVARPPGKEACNISLLSGGEKTLTCVALLLAVFRSKPSPFCILDEVDAALDESNIGRFVGVLREFLSFTQFVVVSHSKKTMSGADTLYGITMQESGVSNQVSVRFEDANEDGQVLPSGISPGGGQARQSPDTDDDAQSPRRAA